MRTLCKGCPAAWELLGQRGLTAGGSLPVPGRHRFEVPSQTAAKRLFPSSAPAHASES